MTPAIFDVGIEPSVCKIYVISFISCFTELAIMTNLGRTFVSQQLLTHIKSRQLIR